MRLLYHKAPDLCSVVHRRRSPPHTRSDEQYLRRPRSGAGDMSRPVLSGFLPFRFRKFACTTIALTLRRASDDSVQCLVGHSQFLASVTSHRPLVSISDPNCFAFGPKARTQSRAGELIQNRYT